MPHTLPRTLLRALPYLTMRPCFGAGSRQSGCAVRRDSCFGVRVPHVPHAGKRVGMACRPDVRQPVGWPLPATHSALCAARRCAPCRHPRRQAGENPSFPAFASQSRAAIAFCFAKNVLGFGLWPHLQEGFSPPSAARVGDFVPRPPCAALGPLRSSRRVGGEAAHASDDAAGRSAPPSIRQSRLRLDACRMGTQPSPASRLPMRVLSARAPKREPSQNRTRAAEGSGFWCSARSALVCLAAFALCTRAPRKVRLP